MKKVSLIVYREYVETVIKAIHKAGVLEIIDIAKNTPSTLESAEKAEMHPEAGICSNYDLRLTRLIDILKKTRKASSGIKAMLRPKAPVIKKIEEKSLDELYSTAESILSEIEHTILQYEDRLKKIDEQKEKIESNLEQVTFIKDFNVNITDFGDSKYMFLIAGRTSELPSLEKQIKALDLVALHSKQIATGKKSEWVVIIGAHISEKERIEKICREKITVFDIHHLSGTPKDAIKTLNTEKKNLNDQKNQFTSKLKEYTENTLHELLALREEIRLEKVRKEVPKNFMKTDSTFIIQGWVLEKNEDTLKSIVTSASNNYIIIKSEVPSTNPDNPPVYVKTPGWAKSFRILLNLFATPKYNEIDPMIFMGIFFVLFFGIMLGDAGYGSTIIILSLFAYLKYAKHSKMIKNWAFTGIWLGVITTIVGLLTNSFFGDFISRFIFHNPDQQLYSATIVGINLPVEPLRDPLTILVIALIFGLIHLNLGIFLAIYQSYKNKKYKVLLCEHFSWIPLQIGGGLLIGSLLLHMWELGTVTFYIASILTLGALLLRLLHTGPLGFFDITGYIGDWLSYARLLALGLGTTGMALAFNIVAEIIPQMIPVVGIIFVPVILIVAHTANLGLQTLGAAVHSLRLQYVEFFNRFYEGGGQKFTPFKIKRKHTRIKEAE
jgi:V/A-type H+-transporting ATPase subunit I